MCIVNHTGGGLQLRGGQQHLLAFGQQLQVELLLDVLHTPHLVQFQLCGRHRLDLGIGQVTLTVGGVNTGLQALQVTLQHSQNRRAQSILRLLQIDGHRVVQRTIGLIAIKAGLVVVVFLDDFCSLSSNTCGTDRHNLAFIIFHEIDKETHIVGLNPQLLRLFG